MAKFLPEFKNFININGIPVRILRYGFDWRVPQIEIGAICGKSSSVKARFTDSKNIIVKNGNGAVNLGMVEVHDAIAWVDKQSYKTSDTAKVNTYLNKRFHHDICCNAELVEVFINDLVKSTVSVRPQENTPPERRLTAHVVTTFNFPKTDEVPSNKRSHEESESVQPLNKIPSIQETPHVVTKNKLPRMDTFSNVITNEPTIESPLVKDFLVDAQFHGLNMWSLKINGVIYVCFSDIKHRFKGPVVLISPKYVRIYDSLCAFIPYTEFLNLVDVVGIEYPAGTKLQLV